MSPATAVPGAKTYGLVSDRPGEIPGGGERTPAARALAELRDTGRFRLVHYVGLVAIVFVLALVIVWQQASAVRLGYMIEEGERELNQAQAQRDRVGMSLERQMNPLALAEMVRELGLALELEGGAGR